MVVVSVTTGMRETEVLALRWTDIDHEKKLITIQRSLYRGKFGEPKTPLSNRELPLHAAAEAAILALKASTHNRGEYVFTSPKGGVYWANTVLSKVFKPVAERLGLPAFSWRSFRRSAETLMMSTGVPVKAQQAMLGHATLDTTLLYADANLEQKRLAGQKLGDSIFPEFSHIANGVATRLVN